MHNCRVACIASCVPVAYCSVNVHLNTDNSSLVLTTLQKLLGISLYLSLSSLSLFPLSLFLQLFPSPSLCGSSQHGPTKCTVTLKICYTWYKITNSEQHSKQYIKEHVQTRMFGYWMLLHTKTIESNIKQFIYLKLYLLKIECKDSNVEYEDLLVLGNATL